MKLCECGCGKPAPIAKHTSRRKGHVKGQPMRFVNGHCVRRFLPGNRYGCGPRYSYGNGNRNSLRHGQSNSCAGNPTAEYRAYTAAKSRCTDPRVRCWKHYGGRGIRFLFARFEDFIACLGPRPAGMTLDRINNDSHYMPGNVRWATWSEQGRNKRPPRKRSLLPT